MPNAVMVVKTANGYAVTPIPDEIPFRMAMVDLERVSFASKLGSGSYYDKGVLNILEKMFEPTKADAEA